MPLIIMQGVLISILPRIVRLTLSLTWPNVTWLKLSLVVCSLAGVWCVHLIQVFIEPLLALQACQVPCCILILRYAVLGYCTCTNLSTILPVALWKQINTKLFSFLSTEFETFCEGVLIAWSTYLQNHILTQSLWLTSVWKCFSPLVH